MTSSGGESEKFFELSLEMLCIADVDGFFRRVNPAFVHTLGYNADELVSQPFLDFIHPDDLPATHDVIAQLARGETAVRFENRYRCKDGSYRILQWSTESDPKSGILYAAARDVTEVTELLETLHNTEELARSVIESVGVPIVTTGATGLIRSFNRAAQHTFGYSESEVLDRNVKLLLPGEHAHRHDGYLERYEETGVANFIGRRRHVDAIHKDGSVIPIEILITENRTHSESVFIASMLDLSERKAAEATQRELFDLQIRDARRNECKAEVLQILNRRQPLDSLLPQMLGVLARDAGLRPSAVHILDEWTGELRRVASFGLPESVMPDARLGEGLVGQAAASRELLVVRDDHPIELDTGIGKLKVDAVVVAPIIHNDHVLAVLTVGMPQPVQGHIDFVERLTAQIAAAVANAQQYERMRELTAQLNDRSRRIAQQNAELAHASRLKSEFLANMSHELRTPLNAILGFSEIMRDGLAGDLNEKQSGYLREIYDAGSHLLGLINEILDLSKIEAGRMELSYDQVDLHDLANNALTMVRELAASKGVELAMQVGADTIHADPRRLRQILYNLLSNAVKFTPEKGSVELCIERRTIESERWIVMSVVDTGIGIAAEDQIKLFQPFVQLDASKSRVFEGTGLGLALVKNLVDLHGGRLEMTSNPGEGSRFDVWLPADQRSGQATGTRPRTGKTTQPQPGGRIRTTEHRPSGARVLLIEDDESTAAVVITALKSAGYELLWANSAQEGLSMVASAKPDAVILDILLQDNTGWTVLEELSQYSEKQIPVMILSVVADENRQRGFALGACEVLQKPLPNHALTDALARHGIRPIVHRTAGVLIVDDDPRAIEVLATPLEQRGYAVTRAFSGEDALEVARRSPPDLLILDLMMPNVTGFDVIAQFDADPDLASTPILVLTAKSLTQRERALLDRRVEGLAIKREFNLSQFLEKVRQLVPRAAVLRTEAFAEDS